MADYGGPRGRGGYPRRSFGGYNQRRNGTRRPFGGRGGGGRNNYNNFPDANLITVHRVIRKDDDVQMNGDDNDQSMHMPVNRRFDPIGMRHRNHYQGKDRQRDRRRLDGWAATDRLGPNPMPFLTAHGDNDWYKIMIPRGKACSQEFLLNNLQSLATEKFEPINFHYEGQTAQFFVKGRRIALSLNDTCNRITLPDTSKLIVKILRLQKKPATVVTDEVCEKLKLCMSKRYDVATCSLNMSDFYSDTDMLNANLPLELQRLPVAERVIAIIAEHIPELKSLNLSNNRLLTVKQFATLGKSAPDLQQLNLSHNELSNERELSCLGITKLTEVCLDQNPLCTRFDNKQTYVSAIRKIFPKIMRLDGIDLPPPITFDADTPTSLPNAQGSQFINDQIQGVVCNFINWYYSRYDSDSREHLITAYHQQALFSLSTHNLKELNRNGAWHEYQNHCRNLKWAKDQHRLSRLFKGRTDIIALLSKLPLTQHCPESFVVDVGASNPLMLTFTIQGVLKERSSKTAKTPMRHFTRTFITVPSTSEPGVSIVNDMLILSCASPSAHEKYTKILESSQTAAAAAVPASGNPLAGLTDIQQQMVQQFSVQSGMNSTWSARCLAENSWNYELAAQNFLEVNAKQAIPPEAFLTQS